MIARIQQTVVFSILAGLGVWIWHVVPDYSRIYIGFLALAGVYIIYMAILFIATYRLNRTDSEPGATLVALVQAFLREVCIAPVVFLWRQPFRSQTLPDFLPSSDKTGVVFIHGFFCNRAFWAPWMTQLLVGKRAFESVTLEPAFGSIDDYALVIETAVAKVTQATGQAPTLICHSMGGLAARAWLRANPANEARIQHVITLGTPHFGTALSSENPLLPFINTHQMQHLGTWTQQLAKDESLSLYSKFTCWYSNCDNIVAPTSTAMLPGADNRLVTAQGHVSMAFDTRVMQESIAVVAKL